jgi:hypothetical protein
MLTLITGLPGNGKTLYALQYVAAWAKREQRQVWYHGIKGLTPELGWKVIPTQSEKIDGDTVEVPQWWLLPAKSIFLIDEAQNCGWGQRPRGQSPEWSKKLETHRHLGIDGVFITQDPGLIDAHDRKLCELHFHVMRTFGMQRATIHEFRPVRANIQNRRGSIQQKWPFPKEVYKWYTSAEAHTQKARIPLKVWVFIAICVMLPLLAWWTWARYLDPHRVRPSLAGPDGAASAVPVQQQQPLTGSNIARVSTQDYLKDRQERVPGLAFSAPVYDEVTKPIEAPYPAACVEMPSKGCRCYSQQATRLEVPDYLCKGIVAGGFFVAWGQPLRQGVPVQPDPVQRSPQREYAGAAQVGTPGDRQQVSPAVRTEPAQSEPGQRGSLLPKVPRPS